MIPQWSGIFRLRNKVATSFLKLEQSRGHETKQDLQWKFLINKITSLFNHMTYMNSRGNMKKLYFHYDKAYDQ